MPDALALVVVFGCGGLLGLQARINGELGARVDSPLMAASVSFIGGALLLAFNGAIGASIFALPATLAARRRIRLLSCEGTRILCSGSTPVFAGELRTPRR